MALLSLHHFHNRYVFVLFGIIVFACLYFLDPLQYTFMPKCPFKLLTGYSCGGCGFQRCVHALLHGNFIQAIKFNLFLCYAFPYLLVLIINKYLLKGKTSAFVASIVEHKISVLFYVCAYLSWTIIRNIYNI